MVPKLNLNCKRKNIFFKNYINQAQKIVSKTAGSSRKAFNIYNIGF